ncbi:MAG: asparagine synthase-related protein [Pseudomonadota bacterium]|nr:asparagine synthase-related protein [Pseudomonadota bacterium]
MSGLAGLFRVSGPPDRAPFLRMVRALDQRGPDARVEITFPDGALATTVRSPGEAGANPAWDPSGRWCVATDGELLNARTLLAEFHAWGESPEAASSAGIVACLFAARGLEAGLERLAGDVALIAWDSHTRSLHVVRDRAGQRPLHWAALADGTLLVASEPAALLAHGAVDGAPDVDAHRDGLALGAPLPPRTPWLGIRKLAPGERLAWSGGAPEILRWWEESANPPGADGARYRWARSLRFSTELAIQQRVAVDAPIAVALSGGLYAEALLLGTAARRRGPVLAFTVGADGPGDERGPAGEIAARCGAEHVALSIAAADVPALLAEIATLAEPLLTPEALGFYVIARAAGDRGAEVLLTGVGGASLYGGAHIPLGDRAASVPGVGLLGRVARAGAERFGGEPASHRQLRRRPEIDPGTTRWAAVDALAAQAPEGDPTGRALWLDRRLDAERGLAVLDRVTAAHGIRAQSPYADAQLVKLVGSMPVGHLVQVRRPRGLFVEGLAERLAGPAPSHRRMTLPIEAWLADGSLLAGAQEMVADLLLAEDVRRILGPRQPARQQWALVALAAWRRAHPEAPRPDGAHRA